MIRLADKKDLQECRELIKLALDDIIFHLSGTNDLKATDEKLNELFLSTQSRISHKNISVFESDGKIVGMMVSYSGAKVEWLDKNFKEIFQKECNEDEYYIDAIAVDRKFRGQGIAKELIKFTENLAKRENLDKISLIVDENKPQNIEIYKKLDFKEDEVYEIYGHKYKHMIKNI